MKNKRGFTLAEVLVTLAVIGVVAALTIPTLIGSTQEKQAKTSIKKTLSVLNQALTMSIAEDGNGANSVETANATLLKNLFANYMSTLNDDDTTNSITTSDGMIYSFSKPGTTCPAATDHDATIGTDCIIEVDINGNSGSEVPGLTTSYSDLYYFIVYDSNVVPANSLSATPTALAGFRSTGTNVPDNVALDALIN